MSKTKISNWNYSIMKLVGIQYKIVFKSQGTAVQTACDSLLIELEDSF